MERIVACLKLLASCKLVATGSIIKEDTNRIPTILIDRVIVDAIKMINRRFIYETGIPASFADTSSKAI